MTNTIQIDNKIVSLKKTIKNMIKNLNDNTFLLQGDIMEFVDICYILNSYLNNDFFEEILYDTKLKYINNDDNYYIFENIEKIKTFINLK